MSTTSESGFNSSTDQKRTIHPFKAKTLQKAVNRSKLLVALFLFLAACATAAVTYLFVEQQERNDFEDQVSD